MIDWTKADGNEWHAGESNATLWSDVHKVGIGIPPNILHEIVTLHNYRLASERRPTWSIDQTYDDSWGVYMPEGGYRAYCPSLLAAMAEFCRLDKEMPR